MMIDNKNKTSLSVGKYVFGKYINIFPTVAPVSVETWISTLSFSLLMQKLFAFLRSS